LETSCKDTLLVCRRDPSNLTPHPGAGSSIPSCSEVKGMRIRCLNSTRTNAMNTGVNSVTKGQQRSPVTVDMCENDYTHLFKCVLPSLIDDNSKATGGRSVLQSWVAPPFEYLDMIPVGKHILVSGLLPATRISGGESRKLQTELQRSNRSWP